MHSTARQLAGGFVYTSSVWAYYTDIPFLRATQMLTVATVEIEIVAALRISRIVISFHHDIITWFRKGRMGPNPPRGPPMPSIAGRALVIPRYRLGTTRIYYATKPEEEKSNMAASTLEIHVSPLPAKISTKSQSLYLCFRGPAAHLDPRE